MGLYILVSLFLFSLLILFFYDFLFFKLTTHKSNKKIFKGAVSIVVCAKNEANNLRRLLPILLKQDFAVFEVVLVNDQSDDETSIILEEFAIQYDNLVLVTIDSHITHRPGKKFALTLGIKTAKYDHILLTDADCLPSSKNWVQLICNNFNSSEIILGFGGYEKKSGLLNKIIRYDTFNVAKQYFSYSLSGFSYMGVGRNMAYNKSLFFDNKGFANHIHIASGDDDLFIQEVAKSDNVAIEMSVDSHTISNVAENWKQWVYQKRRHITAANLYKKKFKFFLALYPNAQLLFWLSFIILISLGYQSIILILLSLKLCVSYLVHYKPMKQLGSIDLYLMHPFYEIIHIVLQGFFVFLSLASNPKDWSE